MCSAFDAAFTCAAGHDAFRAGQVPTISSHSSATAKMGFPDPAVSTGFVHQLLSALPNIVDAACGCASLLRERHLRFAVTLAVRHQCPDRPGSLVRQGNRSDLLRAPGKQLNEPPALGTVPLDMADHGHGADYQHLAQIAVACPRDAAEPLLATARVLLGHKADPCCHVPTALEGGGIGDAGHERPGEQRADARDLHQAATYLGLPRACPDATIVLEDLLLHYSQLCGEHFQADTRIGRNAQSS